MAKLSSTEHSRVYDAAYNAAIEALPNAIEGELFYRIDALYDELLNTDHFTSYIDQEKLIRDSVGDKYGEGADLKFTKDFWKTAEKAMNDLVKDRMGTRAEFRKEVAALLFSKAE